MTLTFKNIARQTSRGVVPKIITDLRAIAKQGAINFHYSDITMRYNYSPIPADSVRKPIVILNHLSAHYEYPCTWDRRRKITTRRRIQMYTNKINNTLNVSLMTLPTAE